MLAFNVRSVNSVELQRKVVSKTGMTKARECVCASVCLREKKRVRASEIVSVCVCV